MKQYINYVGQIEYEANKVFKILSNKTKFDMYIKHVYYSGTCPDILKFDNISIIENSSLINKCVNFPIVCAILGDDYQNAIKTIGLIDDNIVIEPVEYKEYEFAIACKLICKILDINSDRIFLAEENDENENEILWYPDYTIDEWIMDNGYDMYDDIEDIEEQFIEEERGSNMLYICDGVWVNTDYDDFSHLKVYLDEDAYPNLND